MKKIIFFSILIIFAFFFGWVLFQTLTSKPEQVASPSPLPTAEPRVIKSSVPNNYNPNFSQKDDARKSFLIGKLVGILPYDGTNFSLSYDFQKDIFVLVLSQKNQDTANKEFDAFLLQNSISSRSWFKNLTVSYK